MAGIQAERQEIAFTSAVNKSVKMNKNLPIVLVAGNVTLNNIIGAKKYTGRAAGSEPYTDIVLDTNNTKGINLSLKGESAPSLAGGGAKGLEMIVPGISDKFMLAAYKKLISIGLQDGDKVPDVYGQISNIYKRKIIIGTVGMGGPIDYMYIGPMNLKYTYDEEKEVLQLDGQLIESKEFADTHDLYFRLRARREDQTFDSKAKKGHVPKIYGKSPSKGDTSGRIVITDKLPKEALLVNVE